MVWVEIGQRRHRKDFAGVDIHDQPGGAFRGEVVDDPLQLLLEDILEAEVERQLQRLPPVLQRLVEATLDPRETGIVDAGVADHMRRQRPIRIDAALFMLELHARNAELIDLVLLMRRQMALQVDKALARSELGVDFDGLEAREGLDRFAGGVRRVEDLLGSRKARGCRASSRAACRCDRRYRRGPAPAVPDPEPGHMRLGGAAFEQHDSTTRNATTPKTQANKMPVKNSRARQASSAFLAGPSGTTGAQGGGLKCRGRHGLSSEA